MNDIELARKILGDPTSTTEELQFADKILSMHQESQQQLEQGQQNAADWASEASNPLQAVKSAGAGLVRGVPGGGFVPGINEEVKKSPNMAKVAEVLSQVGTGGLALKKGSELLKMIPNVGKVLGSNPSTNAILNMLYGAANAPQGEGITEAAKSGALSGTIDALVNYGPKFGTKIAETISGVPKEAMSARYKYPEKYKQAETTIGHKKNVAEAESKIQQSEPQVRELQQKIKEAHDLTGKKITDIYDKQIIPQLQNSTEVVDLSPTLERIKAERAGNSLVDKETGKLVPINVAKDRALAHMEKLVNSEMLDNQSPVAAAKISKEFQQGYRGDKIDDYNTKKEMDRFAANEARQINNSFRTPELKNLFGEVARLTNLKKSANKFVGGDRNIPGGEVVKNSDKAVKRVESLTNPKARNTDTIDNLVKMGAEHGIDMGTNLANLTELRKQKETAKNAISDIATAKGAPETINKLMGYEGAIPEERAVNAAMGASKELFQDGGVSNKLKKALPYIVGTGAGLGYDPVTGVSLGLATEGLTQAAPSLLGKGIDAASWLSNTKPARVIDDLLKTEIGKTIKRGIQPAATQAIRSWQKD